MSQPGAMIYTQGFASRPENVEVPHIDTRAPTSFDVNYPIGKKWVDQNANNTYTLTSTSSQGGVVSATWVAEGGSSSGITSIVTQSGTATVNNGQITINGDAPVNTLTSASGSTVVVSLDLNPVVTSIQGNYVNTNLGVSSALSLHNNVITAAGTNANVDVIATPKGTGNLQVSSGNLNLASASGKILINAATAASASIGQATLVAGTVTVSTTAITANSLVFLSVDSLGTVTSPQAMYVSTVTAGVSFGITSADATDTSVVNWWIIN